MNRAPLALGKIKKRLSVANVVSLMALCVALGGTSYAATVITSKNVKNETLTSADVKNRSLLERDFKLGQLPAGPRGPAGQPGPAGSQGSAGSHGPAGPQGSAGARGSVGPDGAHGATGDTGATGPQGVPGPKGDTGATGPQGVPGPKGDTGSVDTSQFYDKAASDGRFLGKSAQAADADKLDGRDLTSLARVGGMVHRDGSRMSGSGFTVAKVDSGQYRLTFPPGTFDCSRSLPIVVANAALDFDVRIPKMHAYGCPADGTVVVQLLFQLSNGATADTAFTFIAM